MPRDADEADVERVLVGADLGHAGQVALDASGAAAARPWSSSASAGTRRDTRCGGSRGRSRAAGAGRSRVPARIGSNGSIHAAQIVAARAGVLVQPVVIGGQVEFADAAGNRGALLDRHQPLVVAQVLADLAGLREQLARRRRRFRASRSSSARVVDLRVAAQRPQHLLLPLEFLQEVGLEIGARGDVGDLEQRKQRGVMVGAARPARRRNARARTGPRAASACGRARSADVRSGSRVRPATKARHCAANRRRGVQRCAAARARDSDVEPRDLRVQRRRARRCCR